MTLTLEVLLVHILLQIDVSRDRVESFLDHAQLVAEGIDGILASQLCRVHVCNREGKV